MAWAAYASSNIVRSGGPRRCGPLSSNVMRHGEASPHEIPKAALSLPLVEQLKRRRANCENADSFDKCDTTLT